MKKNVEKLALKDLPNIKTALSLHKASKLDEAIKIYKDIIAIEKTNVNALHLLGLANYQLGNYKLAIKNFNKAIKYKNQFPEAYNNLGNVFKKLGNLEKSKKYYKNAINIKNDYFEAFYNLANIYKEQSKHIEAIPYYKEAIKINKYFVEAYNNLALSYEEINQFNNAKSYYEKALTINPDDTAINYNFGKLLIKLKEKDQAASYLFKVLEKKESKEKIPSELALAHLGLIELPTKTPPEYILSLYKENIYNWTSLPKYYERNITYKGHKLLINTISKAINTKNLTTLDIGCGTGALGSYLRNFSNVLHGVDLSKEMLSEAKKTKLYDKLIEVDLEKYILNSKIKYDLVFAAAVFIHFSKLELIFTSIMNILNYQGRLAFTIFLDTGRNNFSLDSSGYFKHREDYIKAIIEKLEFKIICENKGLHETRGKEKVYGAAYLIQKN